MKVRKTRRSRKSGGKSITKNSLALAKINAKTKQRQINADVTKAKLETKKAIAKEKYKGTAYRSAALGIPATATAFNPNTYIEQGDTYVTKGGDEKNPNLDYYYS